MIGSGWKSVSLIDVHGSPTFTLWLCMCNLKCPFCHNWRLAINDPSYCKELDMELLIDELIHSRRLIDYLHVTGGEPLIQYRELIKLFKYTNENLGISNSLNTNATLYAPLKKLVMNNLIEHIATDLKTPFKKLIGYNGQLADKLWRMYLESLKLIVDHNILLELRIPVSKLLSGADAKKEILEILRILDKNSNFYVVIEPLFGEPITNPRDREWCRMNCNVSNNDLYSIADFLRKHGVTRIYVREFIR